jgi:hypothetical protein
MKLSEAQKRALVLALRAERDHQSAGGDDLWLASLTRSDTTRNRLVHVLRATTNRLVVLDLFERGRRLTKSVWSHYHRLTPEGRRVAEALERE